MHFSDRSIYRVFTVEITLTCMPNDPQDNKSILIQVLASCWRVTESIMMTSPNGNIFRPSALLALCAGNSPVNSPHKGQWRGALMFPMIWVWIDGSVNNREAGDLRRQRAHNDAIVMMLIRFHGATHRHSGHSESLRAGTVTSLI